MYSKSQKAIIYLRFSRYEQITAGTSKTQNTTAPKVPAAKLDLMLSEFERFKSECRRQIFWPKSNSMLDESII